MTFIGFVFPILPHSENVIRSMSKKYRFRRPLDKQHGKRAIALLKSASQ